MIEFAAENGSWKLGVVYAESVAAKADNNVCS